MAVISVIAGAIAVRADAAATGNSTVDAVLSAVVVGAVTWLGAAALRWDAAAMALVAAATSWSPVGAIVGVATAIVGYAVPLPRPYRSVATAAMVGIALNVAARSQLEGFLGLSAIIFMVLATAISVVGSRRRSRATRWFAVGVVGVALTLVLLATVSLGVLGTLAADDVRSANARARIGLDALADGDVAGAQEAFTDAARAFESADGHVGHPITAVAGLVPGLAQHRRAITELTAAGADAASALVVDLGGVDLDALSVNEGRIDLDAVRSQQHLLLSIDGEIAQLQQTVAEVDSPWLVPRLSDMIDDVAHDLAEQRARSRDALTIALAAPALLGGDEPRAYFIGFTTPAEARGIGGFMGNWAEVTITDGHIELTDFGRSDDLNEAGDPDARRFTTSATTSDGEPDLGEWLARYGNYSVDSGPDGTTGSAVWKNINMSPDMAATGRAIADLYPQSGGRQLDGVFMMDVYTLVRFLEFTGPIELPDDQVVDGLRRVTADTALEFLLHDQYDVSRPERVDLLEDFSMAVVDRLLGGNLPPPTELLDVLGPMVDQGRFTGWAERASEQDLLEQTGLSGTFPKLGIDADSDALAVAFNNAAGNKIDYYLEGSGSYTLTADALTGTVSGELAIELENNAPASGEPKIVTGNAIGLPDGSNRTWVSVFSRLPVDDVRIDNRSVPIELGVEAGYHVTSVFVTLAPGDSATLTMSMNGRLEVADEYQLALRSPPAATPMPISVDVTLIDSIGRSHHSTTEQREPGLAQVALDARP